MWLLEHISEHLVWSIWWLVVAVLTSPHLWVWNSDCDCTWIWNPSIRDKLCEQDAKAPDIGLDWELGIICSFWSSPLDRESGSDPSLILVLFDQSESRKKFGFLIEEYRTPEIWTLTASDNLRSWNFGQNGRPFWILPIENGLNSSLFRCHSQPQPLGNWTGSLTIGIPD